MSARTPNQNEHLAKQIYAKLKNQILQACVGTPIPVDFLAGLISVENSAMNPNASRFEQGVFHNLKRIRNFGFLTRSGLPRLHYNGIRQHQLMGLTDEALTNLATSWGYTQIMGWHVLVAPLSPNSVSDLRDPDKHLRLATTLLVHDAGNWLSTGKYEPAYRIWNTGSPKGTTYDPTYVPNAQGVATQYRLLVQGEQNDIPQ